MSTPPGVVSVAAVDLGATSGRVMLAHVGPDQFTIEQVSRFPNSPVRIRDGLHWDVLALHRNVLEGLRAAATEEPELASFGVDAWGADYALLRGGRLLGEPYHYRDERTSPGIARVHARRPHRELFRRTGIQHLAINTVYQLASDRESGVLALADRLLLIPDLFVHWLTGIVQAERTNASTTALVDIRSGAWDAGLLTDLGYPLGIFPDLVDPGTRTGALTPGIAAELGIRELPAIAVGSHDTASAVVAVPMEPEHAVYISCGTWSLVGVEVENPVLTDAALAANFTNEAGVDGRTRLLRNVMGLWVLTEALNEWARLGERSSLSALVAAARDHTQPVSVFDIDDPRFLSAGGMLGRIGAWCAENGVAPPSGVVATVRSIITSLAVALVRAVHDVESISGVRARSIHVVGGGARNTLLCELIADLSGLPVIAGPVEATAVGNALVQARTVRGGTESLESLRALVAATTDLPRYEPRMTVTGERTS